MELRWPKEQPAESDFQLWRNALQMICPSKSRSPTVGKFKTRTHQIWKWSWNEEARSLHRLQPDGETEDVCISGRKPNRFHYSHSQQQGEHKTICTVEPTIDGEHYRLTSAVTKGPPATKPKTFRVLLSWRNTWIWDHLTIVGGDRWVNKSIKDGTVVAVTDGSYMRELYPNLCSAAYILECSKGRGQIYGAFTETTGVANDYRGELLGLMAIHLILISANRVKPQLTGSVETLSDCLGALKRVTSLPLHRIPSRCRHSNILKTILVHCRGLFFTTYYTHVRAHQDNNTTFDKLRRRAQLNCICDHAAKQRLSLDGMEDETHVGLFPLESVGVFVGTQKMTSDTGNDI